MATKKYVWKFDLEEYLMTKDVKEDFAAKVKPIQTFYMADVARLIAEERTEYRIDTIVNITKLVEAKIRQLACGNNIVVTDNVQYSPGILGLFLGTQLEGYALLLEVLYLLLDREDRLPIVGFGHARSPVIKSIAYFTSMFSTFGEGLIVDAWASRLIRLPFPASSAVA